MACLQSRDSDAPVAVAASSCGFHQGLPNGSSLRCSRPKAAVTFSLMAETNGKRWRRFSVGSSGEVRCTRDLQHRPGDRASPARSGSKFWIEPTSPSMDGKGRWIDNVFIERLAASIYLHG